MERKSSPIAREGGQAVEIQETHHVAFLSIGSFVQLPCPSVIWARSSGTI